MNTKVRVLSGLVTGLLLSDSASAQSVLTYLRTTAAMADPGSFINWTQTLSLPAFDATLGTLTQVRLTYTGDVSQTARGENLTPITANYAYDLSAALTLAKTGGPVLLATAPITFAGAGSFAAFDGGFDFSGPSAFSFSQTRSATGTWTDTGAAALASYTGLGTIDFTATAEGGSQFTGPGNYINNAITRATGVLEVEYTFTPIPEPAAYAVAMGGVAALGAVVRRRRRGSA